MTESADGIDTAALQIAMQLARKRKRTSSATSSDSVKLARTSDDKESLREKFDLAPTTFEKHARTAIKDAYGDKDYYTKFGGQQKGIWVDDIVASTTKSFKGIRDVQILRHIGTAFFELARRTVADGEQEVQAMYVAGRLLLGSNEAASMNVTTAHLASVLSTTGLKGRSLQAVQKLKSEVEGARIATKRSAVVKRLVARARDVLDDNEGDEAAAETQLAADPQYNQLLDDLASWNIAHEIAEVIAVGMEDSTAVVRCDVEAASGMIDDPSKKGKLILVSGLDKVHAELNLVIAYGGSGRPAGAVVYGKKRPCMACFLTLQYARDTLGYDLSYSDHPGGLYVGNLTKVFRALISRMSTTDFETVHATALEAVEEQSLPRAEVGAATVKAVFTEVAEGLPGTQYRTAGDDDYDTGSGTEYSTSDEESEHELLKEFDKGK